MTSRGPLGAPQSGVSKMVVRLSAVICGAAIMFVCSSAAMARSEHRPTHDASIVGTASTYNPYRPGYREGGPETASGERYDPSAWTAAIQTGLREKFGGIRGGRARYALVEARPPDIRADRDCMSMQCQQSRRHGRPDWQHRTLRFEPLRPRNKQTRQPRRKLRRSSAPPF